MIFKSGFPVYRQYDASDCGPVCLRMIAKHYGRQYSLQYLRDQSHVSREGASLLDLRDAAVSIGMQAKCVLASVGYLITDAKLPCIVHWDGNHFVVVYKVDKDRIWVADPAYGKASFGKEAFLSHWAAGADEGYVLLVEPAAEFQARQEDFPQRKGFFFLFSYLKPYRRRFLQLLLAMLAASLIQLSLPLLTQMIVDRGIAPKDVGMLQLILTGQFFLIASRVSVNYIRAWILFHISTPVNITLVHDFLAKLARLPLAFFDVKMLGDILQRISDHQRVESFLTHSVLGILLTLMNLLVFGIVLAAYNLPVFLVFAAGSVLYLGWIRLFLRRRREIDFSRFRLMGKNHNAVIQFILGMQEIRLNNCETKKISDWVKLQEDLYSVHQKDLALTQRQQSGCSLLQEAQNIFITYLSARSVIDGDITLGMMLAIQFIIGQLSGPVEQMVHFTASAQDAKISFERIEEIHSLKDEEDSPGTKREELPPEADIVLSDVSFQYRGPHSEKVVSNVSLTLPHNRTTAIVGASGSGKTTLLKLLLSIYQPVSGQLLIGGIPLADISARVWRSRCGLVMQDGFIFSDTVANNIAPGDGDIDEDRLKQAARTANIEEFIETMPLGYRTRIGPDGQGLSQGQRQRILIARAVYKNPDYLFLDEATNSLDASNESTIMKNLAPFFRNRTVVLVAHRLSTVKNADRIIVLDRGRIAEEGTCAELIARKGFYYNLIKDQLDLGA